MTSSYSIITSYHHIIPSYFPVISSYHILLPYLPIISSHHITPRHDPVPPTEDAVLATEDPVGPQHEKFKMLKKYSDSGFLQFGFSSVWISGLCVGL